MALDLGLNFSDYGQARLGVSRGTHRFELSSGPIFLPRDFSADTNAASPASRPPTSLFNRAGLVSPHSHSEGDLPL